MTTDTSSNGAEGVVAEDDDELLEPSDLLLDPNDERDEGEQKAEIRGGSFALLRTDRAALSRMAIGRIVAMSKSTIEVELAPDMAVTVHRPSDDRRPLEVGMLIEVSLLADRPRATPVISVEAPRHFDTWRRLVAAVEGDARPFKATYLGVFELLRTGKKRHFYSVDGLECILVKGEKPRDDLLSADTFVAPIGVDKLSGAVVVSLRVGARAAMSEGFSEDEALRPGHRYVGRVRHIVDYGAFISLPPPYQESEGLLHMSDLTHSGRTTAASLLELGQELEVVITKVNAVGRRVSLSRKALLPDPFDAIASRLKPGDRIDGICRNRARYGVFVEVTEDFEALAHVTEIRSPVSDERYDDGEPLKVSVLKIDPELRRISVAEVPAIEILKEKRPLGSIVEGRIESVLWEAAEAPEEADETHDGAVADTEDEIEAAAVGDIEFDVDSGPEGDDDLFAALIAIEGSDEKAIFRVADQRELTTPWDPRRWRVVGYEDEDLMVVVEPFEERNSFSAKA